MGKTSDWIIVNWSTVRPEIGFRLGDKGDTSQQNNPRGNHSVLHQNVTWNSAHGITDSLKAGY